MGSPGAGLRFDERNHVQGDGRLGESGTFPDTKTSQVPDYAGNLKRSWKPTRGKSLANMFEGLSTAQVDCRFCRHCVGECRCGADRRRRILASASWTLQWEPHYLHADHLFLVWAVIGNFRGQASRRSKEPCRQSRLPAVYHPSKVDMVTNMLRLGRTDRMWKLVEADGKIAQYEGECHGRRMESA